MADIAEGPFTDYELARQAILARNRARMLALGIPLASANLSALVVQQSRPVKAHRKKAEHKPHEPEQPTRKSRRLHPEPGEFVEGEQQEGEPLPEDAELAAFIIDGECPRCGRVMSRGHKKHLESCQGPPETQPVILTEEELKEQAEVMKKKENQKLAALEIGGLIDYTPEHAHFLVIGSTGTPYQVTLTDKARKCQCIDHRVRHHDCKHIKLTLLNLGCKDTPDKWREAVEEKFKAHADADNGGTPVQHVQPDEVGQQDVGSTASKKGRKKKAGSGTATRKTPGRSSKHVVDAEAAQAAPAGNSEQEGAGRRRGRSAAVGSQTSKQANKQEGGVQDARRADALAFM